jgi:hypothetical protein
MQAELERLATNSTPDVQDEDEDEPPRGGVPGR